MTEEEFMLQKLTIVAVLSAVCASAAVAAESATPAPASNPADTPATDRAAAASQNPTPDVSATAAPAGPEATRPKVAIGRTSAPRAVDKSKPASRAKLAHRKARAQAALAAEPRKETHAK
jgi:hypothetical protein